MYIDDKRTEDDNIHDQRVAEEFNQVINSPELSYRIKNYSLFIKKLSGTSKFEVGSIYIGTRICQNNGEEYEESVVLYIEERQTTKENNDYVIARTIYREISKKDKENNIMKYVIDIYDYMPGFCHSHPYNVVKNDGAELLYFNGVYLFEECDDVAGVWVSSITKAELRGWWLIPDDVLIPELRKNNK